MILYAPTLTNDAPALFDQLRADSMRFISEQPALPLPGAGDTIGRWRRLAEIASSDVCLVKILEAHYDALAILSELGEVIESPDKLHAVWASDSPSSQLQYGCDEVSGTKAWCSGASMVDCALVTARGIDGRNQLVKVFMDADGIAYDDSAWHAVGMSRISSGTLHFTNVRAQPIGAPDAYLIRPGFWHGGAGIAACWFGAAAAIAERLRHHQGGTLSSFARAHLGAIDVAISATAAHIRATATLIDHQPHLSHLVAIMQSRALAENLASEVMDRVGRSLGPGPLCNELAHARRCSDLSVFVRQSHAEHDWALLGDAAAERAATWTL